MRINRTVTLLSLGLVAGCSSLSQEEQSLEKPNFVFILVDDLGGKDIGCFGSTFYETPNIDKFATESMKFTNAYAACPVCSPTRASIMTGKHPARVGITDWIPGTKGRNRKLNAPAIHNQLPLEEVTIAEALKKNGYKTFFAGKWHLGGEGFFPDNQGFEINKGGMHRGSPPGGYYDPYKNPNLENRKDGEYLTDRLTDESINFLKKDGKKQPFLLFLSFYTVHTPLTPCRKHVEKFTKKAGLLPETDVPAMLPDGKNGKNGFSKTRQDRPDYASMVHSMDENTGRILDTLKELNLDKNTVVIFMSDNGGYSVTPKFNKAQTSKYGPATSNLPYRSGKGWCYEGGIHEPLIIRWPGETKAGSICDEVVISHDFYPTMLEMAGIKAMPNQHADGKSLVPLLKGDGKLDREAIFWHYPHYHGSGWKPGGAVRAGDWKLIEFFEDNRVELYNLKIDLGETNDLSEVNPAKTKELHNMLKEWRNSIGAKMPVANPDYVPPKKNDKNKKKGVIK